jgi:poly-beta-1,6-N-acetyl-D-glucosamine biosynthesis protein PgaD
MEKPRQGSAYIKIIDQKNLKSKTRLLAETLVTLGFWGIILYLLSIFITFVLWLMGINLVYSHIFMSGYQEILKLSGNAAKIILIVLIVFLSWSYYNYFNYKRKTDRRKTRTSICFDSNVAEFFNVDLEKLQEVKNSPYVMVLNNQDPLVFRAIDLPGSKDT